MRASAACGTQSVQASRIVVSISPNSFTCVEPASLRNALPAKTVPGTVSRNRLPPCGKIAAAPVRMLSPRTMVVCPTSTLATSVMVFSVPWAARRWVHPCPAHANGSVPEQVRKWCRVAVLPSSTNEIVCCSCFVSGNIVRLRVHWAQRDFSFCAKTRSRPPQNCNAVTQRSERKTIDAKPALASSPERVREHLECLREAHPIEL